MQQFQHFAALLQQENWDARAVKVSTPTNQVCSN
jgi:hypothetical protein